MYRGSITYSVLHVQKINSLTGSWIYEYGASRYKTIFFWDFTFTFMEIPPELIDRVDPTEPIMWVLHFKIDYDGMITTASCMHPYMMYNHVHVHIVCLLVEYCLAIPSPK